MNSLLYWTVFSLLGPFSALLSSHSSISSLLNCYASNRVRWKQILFINSLSWLFGAFSSSWLIRYYLKSYLVTAEWATVASVIVSAIIIWSICSLVCLPTLPFSSIFVSLFLTAFCYDKISEKSFSFNLVIVNLVVAFVCFFICIIAHFLIQKKLEENPFKSAVDLLPFLYSAIVPLTAASFIQTLLKTFSVHVLETSWWIIWCTFALVLLASFILTWIVTKMFLLNRTKKIVLRKLPDHYGGSMDLEEAAGSEDAKSTDMAARGIVIEKSTVISEPTSTISARRAAETMTFVLVLTMAINAAICGAQDVGITLSIFELFHISLYTDAQFSIYGPMAIILTSSLFGIIFFSIRPVRYLGREECKIDSIDSVVLDLSHIHATLISIISGFPVFILISKIPSTIFVSWLKMGWRGSVRGKIWIFFSCFGGVVGCTLTSLLLRWLIGYLTLKIPTFAPIPAPTTLK